MDGVSEKPPIPWVELVEHYHEFKSGGPYGTQEARLRLAYSYIDHPERLSRQFFRSVDKFGPYTNVSESFVGGTRTDPQEVGTIEEISTGLPRLLHTSQGRCPTDYCRSRTSATTPTSIGKSSQREPPRKAPQRPTALTTRRGHGQRAP